MPGGVTVDAPYTETGLACLRRVADAGQVARLRMVADEVAEGGRRMVATNGEALPATYLWLTHPACEAALFDLALARLAAGLMGSRTARLFYDEIIAKPPGASRPTRWHQDASHWCVAGEQVCTLWLALDDVGAEDGAVRYIPGSQASGRIFRPWDGAAGDVPPPEAAFERMDSLSFDLRAGDAVVHQARVVHGSFANTAGRHTRRAYVTRWLGDDAVYHWRGFDMPVPVAVAFEEGQPFDHGLFPLLYEQAPAFS
ncbi:phytanoyl-CoA dioxygenase family protein [Asticcacaulis solisilvae]|uniref:phytanoyl-CoA dioxygenase family protein n=1 Tax=Asticcacaulis solisilvae TaxID=1217274 RepID=UPI003FD8466C